MRLVLLSSPSICVIWLSYKSSSSRVVNVLSPSILVILFLLKQRDWKQTKASLVIMSTCISALTSRFTVTYSKYQDRMDNIEGTSFTFYMSKFVLLSGLLSCAGNILRMCRWQVICMWLEIGQWQSFWRKGDRKSTKNHTLTQVSLSKLSSFSIFAWVRSTSCKIKKESSVLQLRQILSSGSDLVLPKSKSVFGR